MPENGLRQLLPWSWNSLTRFRRSWRTTSTLKFKSCVEKAWTGSKLVTQHLLWTQLFSKAIPLRKACLPCRIFGHLKWTDVTCVFSFWWQLPQDRTMLWTKASIHQTIHRIIHRIIHLNSPAITNNHRHQGSIHRHSPTIRCTYCDLINLRYCFDKKLVTYVVTLNSFPVTILSPHRQIIVISCKTRGKQTMILYHRPSKRSTDHAAIKISS